MIAVLQTLQPKLPTITRAGLLRAGATGIAWGLALTVGLTALAAWDCGTICLTDVAATGVMSMAVGVLAIGPLALLGRRG